MEYDIVIGLEVHTQVASKTKMWCHCEINTFSQENTNVCEICSGQPGTLPVVNKRVVFEALKLSHATDCKVNKISYFDRKNYFYPDLPKGYQITQFEVPIAEEGFLIIEDDEGNDKRIGIERIQMEEDTGKSTHENIESLIDLNRAGTPLLEIVGKPDIRSAKEAVGYLKKLHSILTYIDVSKGNLQEGNFRADVNISLKPQGAKEYGTRTEIKNLNSFRSVEKAIETEVNRQKETLNKGEKVVQQTLNYDVDNNVIKVLRTKSDAHDYRYFPEPDLLPLVIDENLLTDAKNVLPELPDIKRKRYMSNFELPAYDAGVLTADKKLAAYFEEAISIYKGSPKKVSNWVMVELLKFLNEFAVSIDKSPVTPKSLCELLDLIDIGKISGKMAKDVFEKMFETKKSPSALVKELGLEQISDESAIESAIDNVINNNPNEVAAYKGGKKKLMGFFVGQVMKETKGQANPGVVNKLLGKKLND